MFHKFLLSKASAEPKTRDFRGNCSTPFPRDSLPKRIGSICVFSNTNHRNFPVADAQVEVEMPHTRPPSVAVAGFPPKLSHHVARRKTKNGTTCISVNATCHLHWQFAAQLLRFLFDRLPRLCSPLQCVSLPAHTPTFHHRGVRFSPVIFFGHAHARYRQKR